MNVENSYPGSTLFDDPFKAALSKLKIRTDHRPLEPVTYDRGIRDIASEGREAPYSPNHAQSGRSRRRKRDGTDLVVQTRTGRTSLNVSGRAESASTEHGRRWPLTTLGTTEGTGDPPAPIGSFLAAYR